MLFYDWDDRETGKGSLWEEMLRRGILIRDCSNYRGLKKGYYRVCVGREAANDMLLEALRQTVQARRASSKPERRQADEYISDIAGGR